MKSFGAVITYNGKDCDGFNSMAGKIFTAKRLENFILPINTFMQFSDYESNRFNPYQRHVILYPESKARREIP